MNARAAENAWRNQNTRPVMYLMRPPLKWWQFEPGQGWAVTLLMAWLGLELGFIAYQIARIAGWL